MNPKERFFQDMYAHHPDILFPNRNYEIWKKEEWISESSRCDVIYRDRITGELTLVEIKRHFGSYEDIAQVMRYYGELLARGIKMDNVMILAKGFAQPVEEAITRCNIKAETLDLKRIGELYQWSDEEIEGKYKHPLTSIVEEHGQFPDLQEIAGDLYYQKEYKEYQNRFYNTPQTHYFEIWEFTIPGKGDFLSLKHNVQAFHQKVYPKRDGKTGTPLTSTRVAAWEFFKNNLLDKPYQNIKMWTYNPRIPKLTPDPRSIIAFKNGCVNKEYH